MEAPVGNFAFTLLRAVAKIWVSQSWLRWKYFVFFCEILSNTNFLTDVMQKHMAGR